MGLNVNFRTSHNLESSLYHVLCCSILPTPCDAELLWDHGGVHEAGEDWDGQHEGQDAQPAGGEDPRGVPRVRQGLRREALRCPGPTLSGRQKYLWAVHHRWCIHLVMLNSPNQLKINLETLQEKGRKKRDMWTHYLPNINLSPLRRPWTIW